MGWSVEALDRAVRQSGRQRRPQLARTRDQAVVDAALAPDGPLAARKVFARRHVVVAVAPQLFGAEPAELPRMVNLVLGDPEALPLVATAGAWGQVWATATTVATEQAIAAAVERQVRRGDALAVDEVTAAMAMAAQERSLGKPLTAGQRAAVLAITTSGRGAELVVGVARAKLRPWPRCVRPSSPKASRSSARPHRARPPARCATRRESKSSGHWPR